jgi:hypothetical protein
MQRKGRITKDLGRGGEKIGATVLHKVACSACRESPGSSSVANCPLL